MRLCVHNRLVKILYLLLEQGMRFFKDRRVNGELSVKNLLHPSIDYSALARNNAGRGGRGRSHDDNHIDVLQNGGQGCGHGGQPLY